MDFRKKSKNLRAFIVLLAAFITEILNIKCNRELLDSMIILLVVIIVFMVISSVAIRLVEKIANMEDSIQKIHVDEEEEQDEENESQDINENENVSA